MTNDRALWAHDFGFAIKDGGGAAMTFIMRRQARSFVIPTPQEGANP